MQKFRLPAPFAPTPSMRVANHPLTQPWLRPPIAPELVACSLVGPMPVAHG